MLDTVGRGREAPTQHTVVCIKLLRIHCMTPSFQTESCFKF